VATVRALHGTAVVLGRRAHVRGPRRRRSRMLHGGATWTTGRRRCWGSTTPDDPPRVTPIDPQEVVRPAK